MSHAIQRVAHLLHRIACAAAMSSFACDPAVPDSLDGLGSPDGGELGDAGPAGEPQGYAVVSSDYSATSIALLDAEGRVLRREFVHSGSASAGLVTALSGDVVLPTRSAERGVLTLIDRFRADVITRIDLASGKVLGQLKTHAPIDSDTSSSYSSNPQDYVYVDEETAWVSRYEPKLGAEAGDPDRGLDLLRVDPSRFVRTSERIDFSRWNAVGERTNPNTGQISEVPVYARPAGMVRVGGLIVVGVITMSATFDAAGKGLVALVRLDTQAAEIIELEGLTSCGSVAPVPDDALRVAVACTGFERGVPREGAGFAVLRVQDDQLVVERVWRAREHPAAALTRYAMIPLSATELLAVAAGEAGALTEEGGRAETRDKLFRIDMLTGAQHEVFEAKGRYVLGGGAYDARAGLLLVPDASTDERGLPTAGVRCFRREADGSFVLENVLAIHQVLPARQVRAFH